MRSPDPKRAALSPTGLIARAHDPDRFLCALFVPPDRREFVFTLVAFNHELARALDVAASSRGEYGAMGGHVRLQWWREVVEGDAKAHEVATPLAALLDQGLVERELLLAMIDAREAELDGFPDGDWRSALRAGPGGLARAIGQVLAVLPQALDAIADAGAAYSIGKILRHRPTLLAAGRHPMPQPMLRAADQSPTIALACALLEPVRSLRLGRPHRAAALGAVLARRDLARAAVGIDQDHDRSLADRLAVATAALTPQF